MRRLLREMSKALLFCMIQVFSALIWICRVLKNVAKRFKLKPDFFIMDFVQQVEHQIDRINKEQQKVEQGYSAKKLSRGAMNLLKRHDWPGNVRELQNVLTRASVWANGDTISEDDIRESLFGAPANSVNGDGILHRDLDDGIDLDEILKQVERHYLERAMELTGNSSTPAARMLGFKNYQTLDNRLKTHGLKT